jgi:hypothetical protein
MPRKTVARAKPRTSPGAKRNASPDVRLHLPRTWRFVTARLLRARSGDRREATRREVPEIRLSGAWLERIGFPKGRRYLISVDRQIETIYLQAEAVRAPRKR